ncbi:MAG: glycosyltransferase [Deltaproteobacteria bacterium]|nr:glycosyltransferase [Deltaproteobacteria bacterium]
MGDNRITLSFILPARNEEVFISGALRSIKKHAALIRHEVVVADNGSTDATCESARQEGAIVIEDAAGTIAAVRNKGASFAQGRILVFMDADVLLTPRWQEGIDRTIKALDADPMLITGSRCGAPEDGTWIVRYWFARKRLAQANYINSGHLIVTRTLFDRVNGFNEAMKTSEDYDFSVRGVRAGGRIVDAPDLPVIHLGFPATIASFVKREMWHGTDDFNGIRKMLASKPALIALLNFAALLSTLASVALTRSALFVWLYIAMMAAVAGATAMSRFGFGGLRTFMMSSSIAYLYITGRTLALISGMKRRVQTVFCATR